MPDGVGTTHAVKIGSHHFTLRPGTYRRMPAPLFGSRFTTGDPDYNNLSLWQHWVQSCWIGGFGAEEWSDDSMFDEGIGVYAGQHEVLTLARDMSGAGGSFALNSATSKNQRRFIVFNDQLYVLNIGSSTTSILYKWNAGTQAWNLIRTFPNQVRSAEVFNNHIVFGLGGTDLERMSTAEAFTNIDKPDSANADTPYTMRTYRGLLYVGFGNKIWRLKNTWLWDGSTQFYTAEDANYLIASENHLGQLYFASQNGLILRTDGNNTFEMWRFDGGPLIASLRSFDGRLFVSVNEPLAGTTAQEAVLYQFTGAAVTELKRWGKVGSDLTTGQLRSYGGKLYMGAGGMLGMDTATGFGVAAYDPREDAYHLVASNRDGATYAGGTEGINWTVDDVIVWHGWLWASVRGHGIFRTVFSYRDISRYQATYDTSIGGALVGPANRGWYTSSDFDGGTPGLLKLWHAVTLDVDLPTEACSVMVEYSLDGGVSWGYCGGTQAAATIGGAGSGKTGRLRAEIKLQKNGLRSARFKLRVSLHTTATNRSPMVRGVTVRYLPIPEPNALWTMTLVLSSQQELLDGTIATDDVATKLAYLRTQHRAQNLLTFTEPDGTLWARDGTAGVLIYSMEERLPHIGPSSDGTLEYEVAITLMEVVEAYV